MENLVTHLTMKATWSHNSPGHTVHLDKLLTWTTVVRAEMIAQHNIPWSVDESHSDGK